MAPRRPPAAAAHLVGAAAAVARRPHSADARKRRRPTTTALIAWAYAPNGAVFGLAADGTELWTFLRDGEAGGGSLVGRHIYVGDGAGTRVYVRTGDGRLLGFAG